MISSLLILFVSIVLEALPFVFLWTIVASIIHVTLTPKRMQQLLPQKPLLAYPFAWLMWLVIPVCECVSVPLLKELLKKKVPMWIGITFMASAPIVNPLVMTSTRFAFSHNPSIFWRRIIGGFLWAIAIGAIFSFFIKYIPSEKKGTTKQTTNKTKTPKEKAQSCHHSHEKNKRSHCLSHFLQEFTTVCWYLIMWAFLASLAKTFIPIARLESLSNHILIRIFKNKCNQIN